MPLYKALTPSHLEAFNWDSCLVRETRNEYFRRHSLNFSAKNTSDLSEVVWHMIMATELLGSSIYKIKETWVGPDELWQANYAPRTLPKVLNFLRTVPPLESPKIKGLMGIHDPDALCHFYRVTHCPWCRKVGQMRAHSSTTSQWYIIDWVWSARSAMATYPPCWRLSITMGGRNVNPWGGRPQQVILISVTASRCTKSISPKQESGQRI